MTFYETCKSFLKQKPKYFSIVTNIKTNEQTNNRLLTMNIASITCFFTRSKLYFLKTIESYEATSFVAEYSCDIHCIINGIHLLNFQCLKIFSEYDGKITRYTFSLHQSLIDSFIFILYTTKQLYSHFYIPIFISLLYGNCNNG